MKKRLTKKMIVEAVVAMDMDTYKKEKNSLSDDDKVVIKKDEKDLYEEEDIETEKPTAETLYERFIRIANK